MTRVSLALAIGGPLLVTACTEPTNPPVEIRAVRIVVVDPKPMADDRRAVGEVLPRYESDLGFRVPGKVIARAVDVGASVRKGDLLARLDDQDYRNKLKAADADLVSAHAALVEAQASEARYRQLLTGGVTTRANYDGALKNLRSAEAKVDSAKASLELAKDQLAYTELRADFDGIVTGTSVEPGQVVNTGQIVLRLARPDDKDAVFAIAESVFGERSTNGEKPEVVVALLSNTLISAEGVVREISPVADASTRTYQVKVTLRNPPEQMRFGSSIVGRLKASTAPVVVLPGSALFDKGGAPAVWVVDPTQDSVALKTVVIGRYESDRVVVKDGLSSGDIVVTAGVNRLRENQKVQFAQGGL